MADIRTGLSPRMRLTLWGGAAAILLAPAVAMVFTREVAWGPLDFALIGTLLLLVGGACELAARQSPFYRAGVAVAALTALALIWITVAVGVIGDEGNRANLLYGVVLALAVGGAIGAQFRPAGMSVAFATTAVAQAIVGVVALASRWGADGPSYPYDIAGLTIAFTLLWLLTAGLFRVDARRHRNL
jgi:hypothetical protein